MGMGRERTSRSTMEGARRRVRRSGALTFSLNILSHSSGSPEERHVLDPDERRCMLSVNAALAYLEDQCSRLESRWHGEDSCQGTSGTGWAATGSQGGGHAPSRGLSPLAARMPALLTRMSTPPCFSST